MKVLPVDTRPAYWSRPNGWGSFRPNGKRRQLGMTPNRTTWSSDETWSARLFVGFNVGEKTVWTIDDLIDLVSAVREEQTGNPSSSFIAQRGIYKHVSGDVVEEPGAQAIIINMGEGPASFEHHMVELAEAIADKMHQEEVVVELQKNGVVQRVFGVSA